VALCAQHQVYELYRPSEAMSKDELAAHIHRLGATKPALIHQAGKHVRRMETVFRIVSKELGIPRSKWSKAVAAPIQHHNPPVQNAPDGRNYTISAVARSEVDVRLFAKALFCLAEQKAIDEKSSKRT